VFEAIECSMIGQFIGNAVAGLPQADTDRPPAECTVQELDPMDCARWYSTDKLAAWTDEARHYCEGVLWSFYDAEIVIPGGRPPAMTGMSDAYILARYKAGFRWTGRVDRLYVEHLLKSRHPRRHQSFSTGPNRRHNNGAAL
jgi:hypothetical protein